MTIPELLAAVPPTEEAAAAEARRRWDSLAKPLGSLGRLEQAVVRVAALTGDADVVFSPRTLFVFCADNGVVARGVTQCGQGVTAAVAGALANGTSTVCRMAVPVNCRVVPVDVGMAIPAPLPGVIDRRVRSGTADITVGPAMTRGECEQALLAGAALALEQARQGVRLLAVGEMGIGNTTTGSAVTAALLKRDPDELIGRGAGLSNEGLFRKRAAVHRALAVNRPDPTDPVDLLAKVGGLDLAAMCGAFLGAAAARLPVVVDGMISAAAALCAVRLCPAARGALLASHLSAEPAGQALLAALDLPPLICADLRLGEGSGAVAALPLLDMALAVYRSGQTFDRLGIDAYTPQF